MKDVANSLQLTELEVKLIEALRHLLEVQVQPSTTFHTEWHAAISHGRAVLRDALGGSTK